MRTKLLELDLFLKLSQPLDILCISEHWLNTNECNEFTIEDYILTSYFCRSVRIHGGVSIYVHKTLQDTVTPIDLKKYSREIHCEFAGLRICDTVIITFYRSPNGDVKIFLENLNVVLSHISLNSSIFLIGDFNVDFLNDDNNVQMVKHLLLSFNLDQSVFQPTRGTACLDNVFTNYPKANYDTVVYEPNLSDHMALCTSFWLLHDKQNKGREQLVPMRLITSYGLFTLYNQIENTDWSFVDQESLNGNNKFDLFTNIIINAVQECFPLRQVKLNGNSKKNTWFNSNSNLILMRDNLNFLNELYKKNLVTKDEVNKFRSKYRSELNNAKKHSNDLHILKSSNKQKAMWEIIKPNNQNLNSSMGITGEEFNSYFSSIAEKLISNLPVSEVDPCSFIPTLPESSFQFKEVSFNEIRSAINSLKNTNSKDIYEINTKIVKTITNVIIVPLTKIINHCIRQNLFPDALKLSKVIPIFKKGTRDNVTNYRPISLIPIFGKIFETALKNQISHYFEHNALFNTCQYGFRSNCSTTMAISKLSDIVLKAFADKDLAFAVCLDLSKAFDSVSHSLLLKKLNYYGFDDSSILLMKRYLENRYQCVCVNNSNSSIRKIKHGVPQGSILGPTLFLIYVNDLPHSSNDATHILFADDTTLGGSSSDIESMDYKVNKVQLEVNEWFLSNRLSLNSEKTQVLYFSLREIDKNTDSIKLLGIILDSKMSWENHINSVASVLSRKLYILRRLKSTVSQSTLITAYFGFIHSRLSYGILVWGHSCHTAKLFAIQRKCIRIIANLKFRDDCRSYFKSLRIMTLPAVYIFNCLIHVKKNYNDFSSLDHIYNTRHKNMLQPEFNRLSCTRNSLRYYCSVFYNKLPLNIKELPLSPFTVKIKNLLIENSFYSYNEFTNFKCST